MPQKAWSKKDERQYEHIKRSAKDRGYTDGRVKMNKSELVSAIRRRQ